MKTLLLKILNKLNYKTNQIFFVVISIYPYFLDKINRYKYYNLSIDELKAKKKSNTVFICGTGRSILEIKKKEWEKIEKYDVFSFRDFNKQNLVKVDFHLTGEVDDINDYSNRLNNNKKYDEAYFIIQQGLLAIMGNKLIGKKMLRQDAKIFRYFRKSRGQMLPLCEDINIGITHGFNSLTGVINMAYLLGWKKIILVGVDMNNHSYFYTKKDEVRTFEKKGIDLNTPFTNVNKTINLLKMWKNKLQKKNIVLEIYNSESKLTSIFPTFNWASLLDEKK